MLGMGVLAHAPQPFGRWDRLAAPLLALSNVLYSRGTDEGAMSVTLVGVDQDRQRQTVNWALYAGSGDGPHIPGSPAVALVSKLADAGFRLTADSQRAGAMMPGAGPCVGMLSVAEILHALRGRDVYPLTNAAAAFSFEPAAPLPLRMPDGTAAPPAQARSAPARAMGEAFFQLPAFMRRFHATGGRVRGSMTVTRGRSWLARALASIGGLPAAAADVPIVVTADGPVWTRYFGARAVAAWEARAAGQPAPSPKPRHGDVLQSAWDVRGGLVTEQFGPLLRFGFQLRPEQQPDGCWAFAHVTKRVWLCGIPVPRIAMITADGVTRGLPPVAGRREGWAVSVHVRLPLVGTLVRYEGQVFDDEAHQ
jgi:hypothetical protein